MKIAAYEIMTTHWQLKKSMWDIPKLCGMYQRSYVFYDFLISFFFFFFHARSSACVVKDDSNVMDGTFPI
uniref:Bm13055, isoform a n=1 Tax=Brugia malayi TaxID=6279 RepID=A0A1I9G142_BRUMA|nr:Bm13055, isoform a [Brugia malayi]